MDIRNDICLHAEKTRFYNHRLINPHTATLAVYGFFGLYTPNKADFGRGAKILKPASCELKIICPPHRKS